MVSPEGPWVRNLKNLPHSWQGTGFGPGCPRFARFSAALATVAVACQTAFFGFVFEKQWTSLALPATGLQFLAGNGPFLALSQTRPAAAPHLQHPNGPPWAEKAPKRANHQPIWPPVHGKASWGLATPNAGHLVWPPNLACWALCTFHSSFPPRAPPCGPGTPCPGTKMTKLAKMLRHHIVGGQLGCGLGL